MSTLKILVVDDTVEIGTALKRLLEPMGHFAITALNMDEALTAFSDNDFDLALIDCFIPGEDGFSISKKLSEIIKERHLSTKLCLMSGILVDRSSVKEATSYNYISSFLPKPISKEHLQKTLSSLFTEHKVSNIKNFLQDYKDLDELKNALNDLVNIKGFEASLLLNQLSDFEFTGELTFSENNIETKVIFNSGYISSVFSSNFGDSIGELLVGLGYLTRDNLSAYLSSEDFKEGKLRIGDALVKANFISPHSIPIALKEQKKNRISNILDETTYSFSFKEDDDSDFEEVSSLNTYEILKQTSLCLKNLPADAFAGCFKNTDFKFKLSGVNSVSNTELDKETILNLVEKYNSKTSLSSDDSKKLVWLFQEKCIELAENDVKLEEQQTPRSSQKTVLVAKLKYLKQKIKDSNPYALFDLSPDGVTDQRISKKYQSLAKELHPDKLSKDLNEKELGDAELIFAEVTKAFNSIKTAENRQTFESLQENLKAQTQIDANHRLERAKKALSSGRYSEALQLLDTEDMHSIYPNEFGLYFLWASLKSTDHVLNHDSSKILAHEHKNLKNEPLYYYLKSLIALDSNDLEGFEKFVNLSLSSDSHFLPARRELQIVRSQNQTNSVKKSSWFSFKKSS